MCLIICIMMYLISHWPQLAYDTQYLFLSFEIGWCVNIHQDRHYFLFFMITSHRNTSHGNFLNLGITVKVVTTC